MESVVSQSPPLGLRQDMTQLTGVFLSLQKDLASVDFMVDAIAINHTTMAYGSMRDILRGNKYPLGVLRAPEGIPISKSHWFFASTSLADAHKSETLFEYCQAMTISDGDVMGQVAKVGRPGNGLVETLWPSS